MAELRSFGLKSVKMGDVAEEGGMGTALTLLGDGNTYEGTASFVKEEDEEVEFHSEEHDDPIEVTRKKGKAVLAFSIVDLTPDTLIRVLGGTVDEASGNWESPDVAPEIEQSVEVITKKDVKIQIVRGKVSASIDWPLTKDDLGKVVIKVVATAPTLADTPAYKIGPVEE